MAQRFKKAIKSVLSNLYDNRIELLINCYSIIET